MKKKYRYMADLDHDVPWLIRVSSDGVEEFIYPGEWKQNPRLASDLKFGYGSFIDYDDISDERAAEILRMNQEKYAKHREK